MVDDDPSVVGYVTDFLARQGITVVSAGDCATGVALQRGGVFDVVILDQRLPDGNGLAVLQEFRNAGVVVPIMVLTAFPVVDEAFEAARLGAVTYYQKPLIGVKLLRAVWATVDGGRASAKLNPDHSLGRELLLETAVALRDGDLPPDLASRLAGFLAESSGNFVEFVALASACHALVAAVPDIGMPLPLRSAHSLNSGHWPLASWRGHKGSAAALSFKKRRARQLTPPGPSVFVIWMICDL